MWGTTHDDTDTDRTEGMDGWMDGGCRRGISGEAVAPLMYVYSEARNVLLTCLSKGRVELLSCRAGHAVGPTDLSLHNLADVVKFVAVLF